MVTHVLACVGALFVFLHVAHHQELLIIIKLLLLRLLLLVAGDGIKLLQVLVSIRLEPAAPRGRGQGGE